MDYYSSRASYLIRACFECCAIMNLDIRLLIFAKSTLVVILPSGKICGRYELQLNKCTMRNYAQSSPTILAHLELRWADWVGKFDVG